MAGPKHYSMSNNTAANDITGDRIQTKGILSDQGRKNFDNIDWGKRAKDKAKQSSAPEKVYPLNGSTDAAA